MNPFDSNGSTPLAGPVRLKIRTKRLITDQALILAIGSSRSRLAPFDAAAERLLWRLAIGIDLHDELAGLAAAPEGPRLADWLRSLAADGFLESASPDIDIDPNDVRRFDRLLNRLSMFETPERSRYGVLGALRAKKVGVVGVGGLASWILYNLACCGIGNFRLFDEDVVEASNLNRSILFSEADIGRRKIDAVRDSLLRFDPRATVETTSLLVTSVGSLVPHLNGLDLLIATGDKPSWLVREWVALAAREAGVPVLHPGGGRVGPFDTLGTTGCAMCEWSDLVTRHPQAPTQLAALRRLPASDPGPISPVGAMTAAMAAMEAFRFLAGETPRTVGRIWRLNDDLTSQFTSVSGHPRCPVCATGSPADRIGLPSELIVERDVVELAGNP